MSKCHQRIKQWPACIRIENDSFRDLNQFLAECRDDHLTSSICGYMVSKNVNQPQINHLKSKEILVMKQVKNP